MHANGCTSLLQAACALFSMIISCPAEGGERPICAHDPNTSQSLPSVELSVCITDCAADGHSVLCSSPLPLPETHRAFYSSALQSLRYPPHVLTVRESGMRDMAEVTISGTIFPTSPRYDDIDPAA